MRLNLNRSDYYTKKTINFFDLSPFCTFEIFFKMPEPKIPKNSGPGRVLGLRISRAGFRVLKFFVRVPGRAPGFILKFSGFRDPETGPRPSLVLNPILDHGKSCFPLREDFRFRLQLYHCPPPHPAAYFLRIEHGHC